MSADDDQLRAIRDRLGDDRGAVVASPHEPRHDLYSVRVAGGTGLLEQAASRILDFVEPSVQREQGGYLDDAYGRDPGVVIGGETACDLESVERLAPGVERNQQPAVAPNLT